MAISRVVDSKDGQLEQSIQTDEKVTAKVRATTEKMTDQTKVKTWTGVMRLDSLKEETISSTSETDTATEVQKDIPLWVALLDPLLAFS